MLNNSFIRLLLLGIFVFLVIGFVGCKNNNDYVRDKIISEIDSKCPNGGECQINLNDFTGFEWDRVVIYSDGASEKEISKSLGFEFKKPGEFHNGIAFVSSSKIIRSESAFSNPEKPSYFDYWVTNISGDENYAIITPQNAIFTGEKLEWQGMDRYLLKAPSHTN